MYIYIYIYIYWYTFITSSVRIFKRSQPRPLNELMRESTSHSTNRGGGSMLRYGYVHGDGAGDVGKGGCVDDVRQIRHSASESGVVLEPGRIVSRDMHIIFRCILIKRPIDAMLVWRENIPVPLQGGTVAQPRLCPAQHLDPSQT